MQIKVNIFLCLSLVNYSGTVECEQGRLHLDGELKIRVNDKRR